MTAGVHDSFIDTTWPPYPRHGNHPLWYADGGWWCEKDLALIASLGQGLCRGVLRQLHSGELRVGRPESSWHVAPHLLRSSLAAGWKRCGGPTIYRALRCTWLPGSGVSRRPRRRGVVWVHNLAESVQVRGGSWELCERSAFNGRCVVVSGNLTDLSSLGLRNRVASVRPVPTPR
jgi:hypothetical protein